MMVFCMFFWLTLDIHSYSHLFQGKHIRGHSNNTWHFFGTFSTPPLPRVTFFNFWWLIFRPKLLWNIEWVQNKVSIEALSCFVTKRFPSKSIKNSVSKSKKRRCDTSLTPPPLRVSRIIWMTPYTSKSLC